MSILSMIQRRIQDDVCVYWAPAGTNIEGGPTYEDPIEINCLWLDDAKTILTNEKREIVSESKVYLNYDVEQHGILLHGSLDSVLQSDSTFLTPQDLDSYEIAQITNKPSLQIPTDDIIVAYLSSNNR